MGCEAMQCCESLKIHVNKMQFFLIKLYISEEI